MFSCPQNLVAFRMEIRDAKKPLLTFAAQNEIMLASFAEDDYALRLKARTKTCMVLAFKREQV